jgi:hypothetical protein
VRCAAGGWRLQGQAAPPAVGGRANGRGQRRRVRRLAVGPQAVQHRRSNPAGGSNMNGQQCCLMARLCVPPKEIPAEAGAHALLKHPPFQVPPALQATAWGRARASTRRRCGGAWRCTCGCWRLRGRWRRWTPPPCCWGRPAAPAPMRCRTWRGASASAFLSCLCAESIQHTSDLCCQLWRVIAHDDALLSPTATVPAH